MDYEIDQILGKRIIRVVTTAYRRPDTSYMTDDVPYLKQLWFEDGSYLEVGVKETGRDYPSHFVDSTFKPSQLSGAKSGSEETD